jgi:autotransporter-associated beta strand protein
MTNSISGAGTIQQLGTGTTILSGSNSCSGMTLVKAGTLLVNNTAGSALGISTVLVTNTGTFGGNGTIGGPLSVGNGGSLTPGFNGSGSLALSDGLALQDGSITSLLISSTTNYTSLVIQGGALTYEGTLQLNLTPYVANASPGDIFSLFSTWGGVTINTNDFSNIQVIGASFTFTDYSGLWIGTDINDNLTYQFSDATGMLTVSSVPEPSTYALFGIGAIGMLMVMRRKKMPEGAR